MHFLNGGFPINFTGAPVALSFDKIQLTMGLVYGSIHQAMTEKFHKNTFIDLSPDIQQDLVSAFQTYKVE